MKLLATYKHSILIVSVIVVSISCLTKCISHGGNATPDTNKFKKFAGSAVCANCHKDVYERHLLTEHHLTSAAVTGKNILGSFDAGSNLFAFDPVTAVKMEKRDSGYYQVEYKNGTEIRKEKFDIVIGSGRKGQSYLNWKNQRLVQLPITFFSPAQQWSNSPGYP